MPDPLKWFYANANNEAVGPFSLGDLSKLREAGAIQRDTLICEDGASNWQELSTVCTAGPPPLLAPTDSLPIVSEKSAALRKRRIAAVKLPLFGALFLLAPYVAVPVFWLFGEFSKRTRILLTVVGAVMTLCLIVRVHNDDLPQNVGKQSGEHAAYEAAKNSDSVDSALAASREKEIERHPEFMSNSEKRELYIAAFDETFRKNFPAARQAVIQQAEKQREAEIEKAKEEKRWHRGGTKEAFRSKLAEIVPISRYGAFTVPKATFTSIFGAPSSTQTLEGEAFWYYECRDGIVQIEVRALNDTLVVTAVNDY